MQGILDPDFSPLKSRPTLNYSAAELTKQAIQRRSEFLSGIPTTAARPHFKLDDKTPDGPYWQKIPTDSVLFAPSRELKLWTLVQDFQLLLNAIILAQAEPSGSMRRGSPHSQE